KSLTLGLRRTNTTRAHRPTLDDTELRVGRGQQADVRQLWPADGNRGRPSKNLHRWIERWEHSWHLRLLGVLRRYRSLGWWSHKSPRLARTRLRMKSRSLFLSRCSVKLWRLNACNLHFVHRDHLSSR